MGVIERKRREKEQRLNNILKSAEQVCFQKGIDNTTMDRVAQQAELSKGTLYLYFRNKEDLHFEINLKGLKILSKLIKDAIKQKDNALDKLIEMGKAYMKFYHLHRKYYDLLVRFESSMLDKIPSAKKKIMYQPDFPFMMLKNTIEQGIKEGEIRNDVRPEALSIILWTQLTSMFQFVSNRKKILQLYDCNEEEILEEQLKILKDSLQNKIVI
jgi:AcrR family transcriptional regulator